MVPVRTIRNRCARLPCARGALLGLALVALASCAPLDFTAHESFDSWYVGKDKSLPVERLGFSALEGNVAGYLVNDVAIRTPLALLRESLYLVLSPVALPYYGLRFVVTGLGGAEPQAAPAPETSEGEEPSPVDV